MSVSLFSPCKLYRLLFWSDCGYSRIERAKLDGDGRVVIVSVSNYVINGLALDLEFEHIYWCGVEKGVSKIEFSKFDGRYRNIE